AAAVPVVVAPAPAAPSGPPAVFQAGLRFVPQAKDANGNDRASAGLAFTWLTLATPYGRGSAVVALESSRWHAGRADVSDRDQVAFYGLGLDWTVPFASHGTGMFVGAEAAGGVLQTSRMTSPTIGTDAVLMLTPHVGGAVAYRGVGLFVDAGWRFQLLADTATSGDAKEGGLLLQGGLRVEMPRGEPRADRAAGPSVLDAFSLGYAARFYAPNGSRVWNRYGGLFGADAGPLVGHELALTTSLGLPRAHHVDYGVALDYLGASQDGGGTALSMLGLGLLATWHAFATRQLLNPYVGARLSAVYISSDDPMTFQYKSQVSPTASVMAGVDVAILRRVALRLGVAYDEVDNANDVANASLSGYAVEAGLGVRL
ncbi:MAG TPA: opacity family porin, partial [Polyangia bacterium]|nr:opacity family porin [Polyangia bacterium]